MMNKPLRLTEEHFDEAWAIIDSASHFMTIPREKITDSAVFSKSFWVKYFDSSQDTYRCYGTFIDNELVHITTMQVWTVMPYGTSGGGFTKAGVLSGKDYLRVSIEHNRTLLNEVCVPMGMKRVYWVSGHLAPRMRRALYGDDWTYMLEEVIPANEYTRYRAFGLLTGTRTYPVDLYIHSVTSKVDEIA